jgi:hypothetical protein
MADNLPVPASHPIDRAALERVLGRAAELQAGGGDAPEVISEADLIEIGREVGLSPEHLRQALAEERTRVTLVPESGVAARLAGPAQAVATRTVGGTPAAVLAALDAWMQREECLQVKRRFGERLTWEPRQDLLGSIMRGVKLGGRGYQLARASEVAATVTAVDASRVLVVAILPIGFFAVGVTLAAAAEEGVRGGATTPFLLDRFHRDTGGATLEANVALVRRNAELAARIAVALAAAG